MQTWLLKHDLRVDNRASMDKHQGIPTCLQHHCITADREGVKVPHAPSGMTGAASCTEAW